MGVRMRHPESGGTYDAQPSQVPFLRESGWQVEPGQDEQGDEWPAEQQRYGGQPEVRLYHPGLDTEITVAESAVPIHRSQGWLLVEDEAEAEPPAGELDGLTAEQLRDVARSEGLPVSGTKAELLARIHGQQQETPAEPATIEEA